ncbi:RDD family protein [Pelagerythrobacter rhizovicinus]|uniref:RDD family protein n=1 Tax=Pelagerythrobacter rhizovicinus TaxID=2268576 RepID=A0A4Q2KJA6_9SPHN|nr:RDD family protein [Pelagerythrobacter rhizovicinus]RXZ64397.1 RDD family protein [Pelagerythrobacter rhizovicinus]
MSVQAAPHLAHRARRRRDVVTPEGIALPFTVASRSARAGALLIDLTLIFVTSVVVTLALIWIAGGLFRTGGVAGDTSGAIEFIAVFWTLFWFLLWNGYFMIMEMGPRGATFGKRAAGIRVASREGGRLTPEAVVARNLLRDIELFLPFVFLMSAPSGETGAAGIAAAAWFLVFLLFPFFNRDALRAGDLIAGTWVVEAPRAALAGALSTEGAAREGASALTGAEYRFGEAELAIYGEYELQTLERVLRDGRPEALESVHQAICRKIGWNPGSGDERAFLEAFYAQLRARLESDMRFGKRKADKFS